MSERPRNVLFLCTGNSARSIIAEAILNRIGPPRFKGYSAGSQPKGAVNPHAIELLRRLDYGVSALRSKSWDEFNVAGAPEMNFIFTLCDSAAAETCPIWPGHPASAHWGLPDPAAATGTKGEIVAAFEDAHRVLKKRLERFVALPLETLYGPPLQAELRAIGAIE